MIKLPCAVFLIDCVILKPPSVTPRVDSKSMYLCLSRALAVPDEVPEIGCLVMHVS